MKKHALTIVLLLLAAALGIWLYRERDSVSQDERTQRAASAFSAWRREEVSRLEIVHENETLILERDAKKDAPWRMKAPISDRSDQLAVERLLTTLEFASIKRRASEEGALGFDTPRATGSVTMGGLTFTFVLGGPSPRPEGSGYFKVGSDPAVVVPKEVVDALLQRSDTLRDRAVVPYLSTELARFEVKYASGGFAVDRMSDRDFKVAGPNVLASREALDHVWGALSEMRAEVFPSDADVERLTAHPKFTIVMTPKDGGKPPAELVIGEVCPGHPEDLVVLRKTPTRASACAPMSVLVPLAVAPNALVERRPFAARADEIEEVRLEWLVTDEAGSRGLGSSADAPHAIEIARKGPGFHAREPFDRDLTAAEADAAGELVNRLAMSIAEVVLPGGEAFTPVARARIHAGERDQILEIGSLGGGEGRVVMRRLLDGARLEVSAPLVRRFIPRATSLAPRVLVSEPRRVDRVVLRCGTPQELADDGSGFRYVEPKGIPADASVVQLVDGIMRGKIDLWVADTTDNGGFGFVPDACRIVLGFEGGNDPLTIHFGAAGEGGVYGTLDGRPGVFVAPKSLRELASQIYVSRAALRVLPGELESVRLTRGGKTTPPIDPLRLEDTLGALYADRVVELGKPAAVKEDVGIEITPKTGAKKRISCAAALPSGARVCAVSTLPEATFEVAGAKLAPLFGGVDAGTVAPDAGPR